MANPFLNKTELMDRDIETALLLEQAIITDEKENATAYCSRDQIFINTEDNLNKLLPAYNQKMLKWLLWHEKIHLELRHHNRFYKYVDDLKKEDVVKEFQVTQNEVNIIMDILVHDSMCKMFPELVETALANMAQMRNRNSLTYTFTTNTLEDMLNEYKAHKTSPKEESKPEKDESEPGKDEDKPRKEEDKPRKEEGKSETKEEESKPKEEDKPKEKEHKEGGESKEPAESESGEPEVKENAPKPLPDEHEKTDWSKLKDIDTNEFITEHESFRIKNAVEELKRKQFKLIKLTETLNGLVTSQRTRTYARPCSIYTSSNILLKGSTPGKATLYLVFDASGSMSGEMQLFKDIISKSIPQAMQTPCEWFAGCGSKIAPYKTEEYTDDGYYKGKFEDFMNVSAHTGFNDDGDRTIELCWLAEQQGYTPIGVTDGGGQISWSLDKLKQLKRTVLVGQSSKWLEKAKNFNPKIQIISI